MSFVDRICAHWKSSDESILISIEGDQSHGVSKKTLAQWTASLSYQLKARGVYKGDRVVLLGSNSPYWVACDFAIMSLGAIVVPLYSRQDPKELAFMAQDCKPSLFIYDDFELQQQVAKHWTSECDSVKLQDLIDDKTQRDLMPHALQDEDIVTIIYTSGTSGNPKGVMLSAGNIDFMLERTCMQIQQARKNALGKDRVFHFLPFCFAGSRLMFWTQLYRDNPVMLSTDLSNLAQEMSTANPEFYLNVPAVLERIKSGVEQKIQSQSDWIAKMYQKANQLWTKKHQYGLSLVEKFMFMFIDVLLLKKIKEKVGSKLEFLICGSAALSPETQQWFSMIRIPVFQVYGLTETTGIVSMDAFDDVEIGKVGKAIDGCEIKISKDGELLCKGPNIFSGYWNREEESKQCFDGPWFRTGDLAHVSSKGHIDIVGRVKNVIIPSSGHNIVPEPIEQKMKDLAPMEIDQAILIGHGRPYLTALVAGSIREEKMDQVLKMLNQEVPHYKKIRAYRHVQEGFTVENGSLTVNQKLKRKEIEKNFSKDIDELYTQPQSKTSLHS